MVHSFRGGIHPEPHKEATAGRPIETLAAPQVVQIPMSMHIGVPAVPLVNVGDHVKLGQKIGDTDAFVSVPVHASVSGEVKSVGMALHPNGTRVMSVVIENDGQDEPEPLARAIEWQMMSPDEMIALIREAGIVGHGGAAFPTHVKIRSALGKVDTMIVNAAECEPYITSDHRVMLEYADDVIAGIRILLRIFSRIRCLIAVENNKPDAVEALRRAIGADNRIKLICFVPNIRRAARSSSSAPSRAARCRPANCRRTRAAWYSTSIPSRQSTARFHRACRISSALSRSPDRQLQPRKICLCVSARRCRPWLRPAEATAKNHRR